MMLRFAKWNDDPQQLAQLIYNTDGVFSFLFGNKATATRQLEKLVQRLHNIFSFKNIVVYNNEHQEIKGLLLAYVPQERNKQKEVNDYQQVFTNLQLLKIGCKAFFLRALENKAEVDGVYISNISVDATERGKGIGTQLIHFIAEWALNNGYQSLWLDVAFNNTQALKLYEKLGFNIVSKRNILFSNKGFYRMRKNIQ